ncbi:MAG: hypothetical protein ABIJ08_00855 [Nanoarchaeota archaeon]
MDNQPEKRDIFGGDSRINQPEKHIHNDESLKEGARALGLGVIHILIGLRQIFFKKIPMNLLFLLIIIFGTVYAVLYFNDPSITGNVVFAVNSSDGITQEEFMNLLEKNCGDTSWADLTVACPICSKCEECGVCAEVNTSYDCPELDCNSCPEKTVTEYLYRYRCYNGKIVNSSDGCVEDAPETDPEYTSTSNGVSISLDDIYFEEEDDDQIRVTEIHYTLINKGSNLIRPKVGLKIYEKYTFEVKELGYLRNFRFDEPLAVDGWIKRIEKVNLLVDNNERTIRLDLFDESPDPNEYIAAIWREFDYS